MSALDRFSFSPIDRLSSSRILIGGKSFVDFTSFDYFNFYQDNRLREMLAQAIALSGIMASAPRSLGGTSQEIMDLEVALGRHFGLKNAVYFSSRQQAVFSLLTCLLSENDLVIFDEDSTAPVIDACYQVGCQAIGIDLTDKAWQLALVEHIKFMKPGGNVFFFFEELSSVTGRFLEFNDTLSKLKYLRITPIIDLTYSFGFSLSEAASALPPADYFIVGGFGFSFPGMGGFVAGDTRIELIKSRSKVLHSEIPLPQFAASFTKLCLPLTLEIPFKRIALSNRVVDIAGEFFTFEEASKSPILSIETKTGVAAKTMTDRFTSSGCLSTRVARGKIKSEKSIVRLNLNVAHVDSDYEHIKKVLSESL